MELCTPTVALPDTAGLATVLGGGQKIATGTFDESSRASARVVLPPGGSARVVALSEGEQKRVLKPFSRGKTAFSLPDASPPVG